LVRQVLMVESMKMTCLLGCWLTFFRVLYCFSCQDDQQ
jgi:hypothetical protein